MLKNNFLAIFIVYLFIVVIFLRIVFNSDNDILQNKLNHITKIKGAYKELIYSIEEESETLSSEKMMYLERILNISMYKKDYYKFFFMLILKQSILALGCTYFLLRVIKQRLVGADLKRGRSELAYLLFVGFTTFFLIFFIVNGATIV